MRYYVTRTNTVTDIVHYRIHNPDPRRLVHFVGPLNKPICGKYRKKFALRHARRLNAERHSLMRKTIIYGIEAAGE